MPLRVVFNKCDLNTFNEEFEAIAGRYSVHGIKTSALTGENVNEAVE